MSATTKVYKILEVGMGAGGWYVACRVCESGQRDYSTLLFAGIEAVVKGKTDRFDVALAYALKHAADHEKDRCPNCGHVERRDVETPLKVEVYA